MKRYYILHFVFFSCFFLAYLTSADNYQVQLMTMVRNNEATINSLSQQMSHIQERCSALELQVSQLKQTLSLERQNSSQAYNDIAALKQQLGDNKVQIQKSLEMAVDRIANETSRAVSSAVKSTKSTPTLNANAMPTGKFYVYKVQEGATLNTIAKAYKVSIESIKKANKLKNSTLSTGQALYIPKTN